MKILFVVNALGNGGAEKIFMDLITNLDYEKYDVTLLMVDHYGDYIKQIPKKVKKKYIFEHIESPGLLRKLYGLLSIVGTFFLRKVTAKYFYKKYILEEYDVEIAFLEGEATKLVAQSPNKKSVKYAWLHTDMQKNPWSEKCYSGLEQEKKAYEAYDRVLAVSSSVKEAFEEKYGLNAQILYNALDEKKVFQKAGEFSSGFLEKDKIRFVSVGRLEEVKGYSRLIDVFAKVVVKYSNIELIIIGEGSERERLEKQIADKNLKGAVQLYGYKSNPYPYIKDSNVLICSSYAEGFSTVVTEALILGVPVITTECAGMRELLGDSEYGVIVENSEEGLYQGIEKMLINKQMREDYRIKAEERGKSFSVKDRIREIETMIADDYRKKLK